MLRSRLTGILLSFAQGMSVMCLASASLFAQAWASEWPIIPRSVLFGAELRGFARVSPDGRHIAFSAPHGGVPNLWVAPVEKPEEARLLTHDTRRGISVFFWTSDSQHLLFTQDGDGDGTSHVFSIALDDARVIDLVPLPGVIVLPAGEEFLSPERPDSVVVSLRDGKSMRGDLYEVNLKNSSRRLIVRNDEGFSSYYLDRQFNPVAALKVTATGGRELFRRAGATWQPVLSWPEEDSVTTRVLAVESRGTSLLLLSTLDRDKRVLMRLDLITGRQTVIADDEQANVVDAWISPEGNLQAYVTEYITREHHAIAKDVQADLTRLEAALGPQFRVVSRSRDDRRWVIEVNDPAKGIASHLYEREAGSVFKLFDHWIGLSHAPLQPIRPVEITSRDGLKLVSFLTLPPGADAGRGRPNRPLPMVLVVHGGPSSHDAYVFRSDHQWLANRGYAVLSVNYRGSTGYGKAFLNAGNGEVGRKMQYDLIDAVEWAVREKIADPSRVAIFGDSFGGYTVLAGLAFSPQVFACGVDVVGPSDLSALFDTPNVKNYPGLFEKAAALLGDPRTEAGRGLLRERSPLFHADRIQRPLLVVHGANDPAVPRAHSDRLVAALKQLRRPVTYLLYPDEGHALVRPANQLSFHAIAELFLAQCLGGRVEPIADHVSKSAVQVVAGVEYLKGLDQVMATRKESPSAGK